MGPLMHTDFLFPQVWAASPRSQGPPVPPAPPALQREMSGQAFMLGIGSRLHPPQLMSRDVLEVQYQVGDDTRAPLTGTTCRDVTGSSVNKLASTQMMHITPDRTKAFLSPVVYLLTFR